MRPALFVLLVALGFAACGGNGGGSADRGPDPTCLARDAAGNCVSVDLNGDSRPDVTCDASATATADNGSNANARGGECNIFFPDGNGNVGHDQDNSDHSSGEA